MPVPEEKVEGAPYQPVVGWCGQRTPSPTMPSSHIMPVTTPMLGIRQDLIGCEKTHSFEGYGLQPVHKRLKIGMVLAAEGRISIRLPTFSAAS